MSSWHEHKRSLIIITLSISTLSISTLSITILSIITLWIMTLTATKKCHHDTSIKGHSFRSLSITTLSAERDSKDTKQNKKKSDTQHKKLGYPA
jgi:hypothetical protein